MNKIKIIESPKEVFWSTTKEGTVEIEGELIEFRFYEDPNGCELHVFDIEEMDWISPEIREGSVNEQLLDLLTTGELYDYE